MGIAATPTVGSIAAPDAGGANDSWLVNSMVEDAEVMEQEARSDIYQRHVLVNRAETVTAAY